MTIDPHIYCFHCLCTQGNNWHSLPIVSDSELAQKIFSDYFHNELSKGYAIVLGISEFHHPDVDPLSIKIGLSSEWQNYLLFRHGN